MSETGAASSSDTLGRLAERISGDPMQRIDTDMQLVLTTLSQLGARPLEMTSPGSARRQPQLKDAVAAIEARLNREPAVDGLETEDLTVDGAEDDLPARLYRPAELLSRLNPVILYFHGGGFVTGDLDSHDASVRALARRCGALVLSVAYRLAPEAQFPAAHEDAYAAWRWLVRKAAEFGGDPRRMAVAGEDAGANLAMNIALQARDEHLTQPVHQLLVHPIAGSDFSRASYGEMLRARPVGMPAMQWRLRHGFAERGQIEDTRINLCEREDLHNLAPTTLILAELDPLRSEGEVLGEALEASGSPVSLSTYDGVTQSFFGLGLIVTKALFAQAEAAEALARSFGMGRLS